MIESPKFPILAFPRASQFSDLFGHSSELATIIWDWLDSEGNVGRTEIRGVCFVRENSSTEERWVQPNPEVIAYIKANFLPLHLESVHFCATKRQNGLFNVIVQYNGTLVGARFLAIVSIPE